jgi:hypothetical protein
MAAKEEVMTTRFTVGALFLIAFKIPVVPFTAGSRRSFFVSVVLKWKGLAVWMTASNGGSEMTALSKAESSVSQLSELWILFKAYHRAEQCLPLSQSRASPFRTLDWPA